MQISEPVRLTQYAHSSGCGCKIAPAVLQQIIGNAQASNVNGLLVGNNTSDDAAVIQLHGDQALISTADFFMPIVDDPFTFGRVAAANALSDVYAMGGKPLMALALLGWPVDKLGPDIAATVLDGARAACAEAGIPLAGGHSIDSPEPMFGLSVNGLVSIDHLKQNSTAQAGDLILLTKPLGVGVLAAAAKRGVLLEEHREAWLQALCRLNSVGEALGAIAGVHAMTDVTGFGLAGHLIEMCNGAALSASVFYTKLPKIAGLEHYLQQRITPDATFRNWNAVSASVGFEKGVPVMEAFQLLPDPQTNGGLLLAVEPSALSEVQSLFQATGYSNAIEPIGVFTERSEKVLSVKP